MLIGFELGHTEEIVQYIELVTRGQLSQTGHLLGDEGNGLLGPAPSPGSSPRGPPRPAEAERFRFRPAVVTKTPSQILISREPYARAKCNSKVVFCNLLDTKRS
jgi:hypothetical protein